MAQSGAGARPPSLVPLRPVYLAFTLRHAFRKAIVQDRETWGTPSIKGEEAGSMLLRQGGMWAI